MNWDPDAGESGLLPSPHPVSRFMHPLYVTLVVWRAPLRVAVKRDSNLRRRGFESLVYQLQPMLLPQLWQR
jgi:hypothetical protein